MAFWRTAPCVPLCSLQWRKESKIKQPLFPRKSCASPAQHHVSMQDANTVYVPSDIFTSVLVVIWETQLYCARQEVFLHQYPVFSNSKENSRKEYKQNRVSIVIVKSPAIWGLRFSWARTCTFLIGDTQFLFWKLVLSVRIFILWNLQSFGSEFHSLAFHCIYITLKQIQMRLTLFWFIVVSLLSQ